MKWLNVKVKNFIASFLEGALVKSWLPFSSGDFRLFSIKYYKIQYLYFLEDKFICLQWNVRFLLRYLCIHIMRSLYVYQAYCISNTDLYAYIQKKIPTWMNDITEFRFWNSKHKSKELIFSLNKKISVSFIKIPQSHLPTSIFSCFQ